MDPAPTRRPSRGATSYPSRWGAGSGWVVHGGGPVEWEQALRGTRVLDADVLGEAVLSRRGHVFGARTPRTTAAAGRSWDEQTRHEVASTAATSALQNDGCRASSNETTRRSRLSEKRGGVAGAVGSRFRSKGAVIVFSSVRPPEMAAGHGLVVIPRRARRPGRGGLDDAPRETRSWRRDRGRRGSGSAAPPPRTQDAMSGCWAGRGTPRRVRAERPEARTFTRDRKFAPAPPRNDRDCIRDELQAPACPTTHTGFSPRFWGAAEADSVGRRPPRPKVLGPAGSRSHAGRREPGSASGGAQGPGGRC